MAALRSKATRRLLNCFPWMTAPCIIAAPMRVMSGPELALAVSQAGGLGFIGPGVKPDDTITDLNTAQKLLNTTSNLAFPASTMSKSILPVGVGFQLWNGDLNSATRAVREYRPCAAWLFAPRHGQAEVDKWTKSLRDASPDTQVWLQIGTLRESLEAANSPFRPDAIVVQGTEAGGHGMAKDGLGLMTLFPEIADAVRDSGIPLFAAGGIADGRGVAAALTLGATGVALGTRFLASNEARISRGYQQEIVRATDGATSTTRTTLYNQLRGTNGWPEQYSPRGVVNRSWHDHHAGVPFEELKRLHDDAMKAGDSGWGPEGRLATYAGASVGLIHSVEAAGVLVKRLQKESNDIFKSFADS
jgi:nitronate monooxygenase